VQEFFLVMKFNVINNNIQIKIRKPTLEQVQQGAEAWDGGSS